MYDCHPFFDIPLKSGQQDHWAKAQKKAPSGEYMRLEVTQYAYLSMPQVLNETYVKELICEEIKNKEGFIEYQQWVDELKKKKKYDEVTAGGKRKVSKRELVQYKYDNAEKLFHLNIYVCWLLCWCATLAYQDPEERDFLVHQAIEVLKRMVYKYDPSPNIEIFEIMMDSAFQHGDENMVRQLFEIYSEEFKLQQNQTMIQMMQKSYGKGSNLSKK